MTHLVRVRTLAFAAPSAILEIGKIVERSKDRHEKIEKIEKIVESRPGDFHPEPLVERCGSLSTHTAPIKHTQRFLCANE